MHSSATMFRPGKPRSFKPPLKFTKTREQNETRQEFAPCQTAHFDSASTSLDNKESYERPRSITVSASWDAFGDTPQGKAQLAHLQDQKRVALPAKINPAKAAKRLIDIPPATERGVAGNPKRLRYEINPPNQQLPALDMFDRRDTLPSKRAQNELQRPQNKPNESQNPYADPQPGLATVSDTIPNAFQSVFKYPRFNPMQSAVIETVLKSTSEK